MEIRRPSLISVSIILMVVLAVILIITAISISLFNNGGTVLQSNNKTTDEKILNSISGDTNYLLEKSGKKINISKALQDNKTVDGLVFESFEVSSYDDVTTIEFDIYNPTSDNLELGKYKLKILDDSANIIDSITDEVGTINSLSRKKVSLEYKGDIANLSNIQVEKVVVVKI